MISCDPAKRISVRMGVSKPPPGRKQGMPCKPSSGHSHTFPVRDEPSQMADSATFATTHRTVCAGSNRCSATNLFMVTLTLPRFRPHRRLKHAENDNNAPHHFCIGSYGVFDAPPTLNLSIGCNSCTYTSNRHNQLRNDHYSDCINARLGLNETIP